MLCESAGLLNISSHVMLVAVRQRYLADEATTLAIHKELIEFFSHASAETVADARRCAELPFQMLAARETGRLADFLVDLGHVRHLLADESLTRELASLWLRACNGAVPDDLGLRYLEGFERYEAVLREEAAATAEASRAARRHARASEVEDEDEADEEGEEGQTDSEEEAYLELLTRLYAQVASFISTLCQYNGAAALQQKALIIDRSRFGTMSERVAERLRELATTQYLMGCYEDAVSNLYRALGIYSHRDMSVDPLARVDYAQTLFEMARVARYSEDPSRAKNQCLFALRTFRTIYGPRDPRLAPVLNRLAMLLLELGPEEQEQAREYATASLELCAAHERSPDDPRFDSTQAEAMHLLGANHLKAGRISEACEELGRARSLALQCEGPSSLLVAEILEDLALARTRRGFEPSLPSDSELEVDEGVQADGATAEASGGPPLLRTPSSMSASIPAATDEEAAAAEATDAMVVQALTIRRRKNPGEPHHVRIAHNMIRRAELFWTQGRFAEIVALYAEASEIFARVAGTTKCKQVSQLASWTASAWLQAGEVSKAEEALRRAEELTGKVFGESSWEGFRVLRDKVAILQACASPSKGSQRDDVARKAYARAERFETRAVLLLQSLQQRGEDAKDAALHSLSYFAPIYRERQWHALPDAPSTPKSPAAIDRQSSSLDADQSSRHSERSSPASRHSSSKRTSGARSSFSSVRREAAVASALGSHRLSGASDGLPSNTSKRPSGSSLSTRASSRALDATENGAKRPSRTSTRSLSETSPVPLKRTTSAREDVSANAKRTSQPRVNRTTTGLI